MDYNGDYEINPLGEVRKLYGLKTKKSFQKIKYKTLVQGLIIMDTEK